MSMLKRCHKTQDEEQDPIKKKKLKLCLKTEEEEEEEGEDMISQLPDALVHHILTQLGSTKEALRTKILSRKWNSLCNSIPILDFGQPVVPTSLKIKRKQAVASACLLMRFIDSVLLTRQDNSPLVAFCLYLHQHIDSSRVFWWISYLITHRIQHLDLVFHKTHHNFAFPCSFFTCHSLTVFKLELASHWKLPTSASSIISFPSLKILSLKYVALSDDVDKLFSGCPVLEELYFDQCKWLNINTVNISALALHTLHLLDHHGGIQVFAPNITSLSFSGNLPENHFVLGNMPSLAHAHIHTYIKTKDYVNMSVQVQQHAIKFLQSLSRVSVLTLHSGIGQALFDDTSLLPQLPTLENLINLTLQWDSQWFSNQSLINILYAVPNLEIFSIKDAKCEFDEFQGHLRVGTTPPQCLLLHLKHVEIVIWNGYTEKDIIEFLLRNARVLQEMVITFHPDIPVQRRHNFSEELAKIPICSPNCQLLVFK